MRAEERSSRRLRFRLTCNLFWANVALRKHILRRQFQSTVIHDAFVNINVYLRQQPNQWWSDTKQKGKEESRNRSNTDVPSPAAPDATGTAVATCPQQVLGAVSHGKHDECADIQYSCWSRPHPPGVGKSGRPRSDDKRRKCKLIFVDHSVKRL